MPPAIERATEVVNNHPVLIAPNRISGVLVTVFVPVIVAVLGWYVAAQSAAANTVNERLTHVEQLDGRLQVVESLVANERQERLDFQAREDAKFDKLMNQNIEILQDVAAIKQHLSDQRGGQ